MASAMFDHAHITSSNPEKLADMLVKIMEARLKGSHGEPGKELIDLDLGGVPLRISRNTGADGKWEGPTRGLHHIGVTVEDLERTAAELRAAGVKFVVEPYTAPTGGKYSFVQLDDVLIEVAQP